MQLLNVQHGLNTGFFITMFENRFGAGKQLAEKLKKYSGKKRDCCVGNYEG